MWKSKLKVKYIGKNDSGIKMYSLKEPLNWDDRVIVPIGFKSDFASVPSWLHWLYPPQGKYSKASIVHDYTYSVDWFDREYSDKIFYKIMIHDRVKKITAKIFYIAVRLFGSTEH